MQDGGYNDINSIIDRIAKGTHTEADIETLRQIWSAGHRPSEEIAQLQQWLNVHGDTLQYVSQEGKFNTNIGQVQSGEIHIGDRIYTGSDAETIKRVLYECGLIKDNYPGFQKVECEVTETIYPVLVHSRHQQLVEKIIFHEWSRFSESPPNIGLQLQGLVNQISPFYNVNHEKTNGSLIINTPTNPPVIVTFNDLRRELPTGGNLKIFFDSRMVWQQEITLQPVTATPTDINQVDALAAFIFPAESQVIELVRQARGKVDDSQPRLGFTNVSSVEAAQVLYQQLCQSRPRRNVWESAPWTPGEVVRLPRQVLEEGEAKCLDLALLLCSAFEQIRRLPVLVGVKISDAQWHVMAGVRGDDEDVSSSALCLNIQEIKASCLPKRTYLFALEVLISGGSAVEAHDFAKKQLAKAKEAFLVDVQAARKTGIWSFPISEPLRIQPDFSSRRVEPQIYIEPSEGLPSELAEEIAKGRAVFLLGDILDPKAAVSRHNFAHIMSQKAESEDTNLLLAGSLIEERNDREALVREAISVLNSAVYKPTEAYQNLVQLPVQTIVSFHPDPVLESLLKRQNPPFRILTEDEDLAALQPGQGSRELYLLGGSALTGKGLVLTIRDHHHLLYRIEVMARGLRDRLALQTLVLLGCDLSNLNLKELYLEATKHLSYRLRPIYLVGCSHVEQWLDNKPYKVLEQSPQELLEVLANLVPYSSRPLEVATVKPKSQQKQRIPYKYLDYFEVEDTDIFFGREDDLEQVVREIWASSSRILVLCGRSGVGKTSLIKAGLIPRLEQQADVWAVYTRFGKDPEQSIIKALRTHLEIEGKGEQSSSSNLTQILLEVSQEHQGELVIFMDQSEEAFIKLGQYFLEQFFSLVRELVLNPNLDVKFVFTLREDYLGRLAKYQSQVPRLLESVYCLQELTREAAREAIVKPAQKCQLRVEDTLIEEILDDLSPDRILPAHLQIVCHRLYQECDVKGLTVGLYEQIGRANHVLKQHLEEAMGRLPADVEPVARKILRSLVTSKGTKDLLSLEQIVKRTGLAEKQVEQAIHDLIHGQRLLREVDGDPICFEFSHESLVDSVAEWLKATDLRIREVQEMLEQEVSNARKLEGFQFPIDKLRLVDEYRKDLDFDAESIRVVTRAFVRIGELPDFWISHLKAEDYYELYIGQDNPRSIFCMEKHHSRAFIKGIERGILNIKTLGNIINRVRLFCIDRKYVVTLNQGIISRNLKAKFESNGISLSRQASISLEDINNQWLIKNGSEKYRIYRSNKTLAVYDVESIESILWIESVLMIFEDYIQNSFRDRLEALLPSCQDIFGLDFFNMSASININLLMVFLKKYPYCLSKIIGKFNLLKYEKMLIHSLKDIANIGLIRTDTWNDIVAVIPELIQSNYSYIQKLIYIVKSAGTANKINSKTSKILSGTEILEELSTQIIRSNFNSNTNDNDSNDNLNENYENDENTHLLFAESDNKLNEVAEQLLKQNNLSFYPGKLENYIFSVYITNHEFTFDSPEDSKEIIKLIIHNCNSIKMLRDFIRDIVYEMGNEIRESLFLYLNDFDSEITNVLDSYDENSCEMLWWEEEEEEEKEYEEEEEKEKLRVKENFYA